MGNSLCCDDDFHYSCHDGKCGDCDRCDCYDQRKCDEKCDKNYDNESIVYYSFCDNHVCDDQNTKPPLYSNSSSKSYYDPAYYERPPAYNPNYIKN